MAGQRAAIQSLQQEEEFAGCAEWDRLMRQFIAAMGDLIATQTQSPFDPASHRRALIDKLRAKSALLSHQKSHRHCGAPERWSA